MGNFSPKQLSREAELAQLVQAIQVERKARYIDFIGRRAKFSQFMRQTADRLLKRYPLDARWATIRGLFRQYPNLDVASRISIVRRTEELLFAKDPIEKSERNEKSKNTEKKITIAPPRQIKQKDEAKNQNPRNIDVKFVKGVGPKVALLLERLGIFTALDLIRHYPRRHLDFQNRLLIRELEPGQEVTIFGTILSTSAFQSKKRNISVLSITISDGTGSIFVTRFIGGKSNKYLLDRYKDQYPKGAQVLASGIVERDRFNRRLQLKQAEIEILGALTDDTEDIDSLHAGRLVPIYPLTEGLGLRYLRNIIHNALTSHGADIEDHLPADIKKELDLLPLYDALWGIHFPNDLATKDEARRRLVFDELFAIQLKLAYRRYKNSQIDNALALPIGVNGGLAEKLKNLLPFQLTSAQERVFKEITRDLSLSKPMHRLVQGDVGSGKTVVAALAALVAIENGYQVAVMAPTEILAEQHYRQFQKWFTPMGLKCDLFLGKQGVKERREVKQALFAGQIHVAIGTHALIQDDIEFHKLGLIIIDEQHRFGVKQRAKLKAKGVSPELLTMTATPIPRTLALTVHGDLDVSEIDELPPGRKPIETKFLTGIEKRQLWSIVEEKVKKGAQAYVVFPLIEESETLSAKAATAEYENLRTKIFPNLRIGLMHGKLKPQEKEEVMDKFRAGEFDILVCTTVIEVGVDVPNASIMVIENADRFGLAQLHQLRGRVGRGSTQSYCYLLADGKSETTRQRLEIMTQTNDGFIIAQKDLELRGPGEFLGVRQSGMPDLILADLVNDTKILEQARNAAIEIIKKDPELETYPQLKALTEQNSAHEAIDLISSG
jgi:ATP-dependent DNA helicase RecG